MRYRALRPWYLVASMVLVWLIGVHSLTDAFTTLLYLREGHLPDVDAMMRALPESERPIEALGLLQEGARLRALGEAMNLAFPLTVAKLVLSGLLVIASGMAMSGRPGARGLALQAILANVVLAVTSFVLLRGVRYGWLDAVMRVGEVLPRLPASASPQQQQAWELVIGRSLWLWLARIRLVLVDVGLLALAALALTRTRTKAFFEAVRRASERAEEP
jgi:hypothetical protein